MTRGEKKADIIASHRAFMTHRRLIKRWVSLLAYGHLKEYLGKYYYKIQRQIDYVFHLLSSSKAWKYHFKVKFSFLPFYIFYKVSFMHIREIIVTDILHSTQILKKPKLIHDIKKKMEILAQFCKKFHINMKIMNIIFNFYEIQFYKNPVFVF